MKKIIIVTGSLAALKSTISKRISEELGIICLNKDDIKEILGDTIGFKDREENLKLSLATFQLMRKFAEDILTHKDSVILESNFKNHELESIFLMASQNNISIFTLFLTGNPRIIYNRYCERQPNRHPVHTSVGLMSFDIFQRSMPIYDSSKLGIHSIEVDTTSFDEAKFTDILKSIKDFLSFN